MAPLSDLRKQVTDAQGQATQLAAQLRQAQQALEAAVRQGDATQIKLHQQSVAALTAQRSAAVAGALTSQQQVNAQRAASLNAPATDPIGALDQTYPIALLPVRLETRFVGPQLLIRVFPDDIHIDTHEPALTEDEDRRVRAFWTNVAKGGSRDDAWAELARFHGPQRAAYLLFAVPAADAPAVPARASSWTRKAIAAAMPDRWIALGYGLTETRIFTEVGSPIDDTLTAGPSPDANDGTAPAPGGTDALAALDQEMKWLVDFDQAVNAGMALRVALSPDAARGLSRVLVVGVKGTMDPTESGAALTGLLNAHRFTNGLAFLRRGTPTNNTADAPSGSQAQETGDFSNVNRAGAGTIAGNALGIAPTAFTSAPGWDDGADAFSSAMNRALWPATWGYYLEQMCAGVLSTQGLAKFQQYFVDTVRGGGPLPALRVGKEPYGVLPVTSLSLWTSADPVFDVDPRGVTVLRNLRDVFRRALKGVPHMGATSDPDGDLLSVLRMSAYSTSYGVRHMFGPWYFANYWSFAGMPMDNAWWGQALGMTAPPAQVPGMPSLSLAATSMFSPVAKSLGTKPLVDAGDGLGYIEALAHATLAGLRSNTVVAPDKRTLLYDLLRHSLLLSYASAARHILLTQQIVVDPHEPELIDIGSPTSTVWHLMDQPLTAVTGTVPLGVFLDTKSPEVTQARQTLKTLANAAGDATSDEAAMVLAETLDTASHRWDAWATSVASRRLSLVRGKKRTGLLIGGYGWVENLSPGPATQVSDGYIHAPSAAHATTAAILASGYMTHRTGGSGNPFAVDLSSGRVKLANRLIEGVRTGQSLAALLGYELERALHDASLSRYVAKFRALAPLPATAAGSGPSEAIGANNVVHGERIVAMWKAPDPAFQALRSVISAADFVRIDAIFRQVDGEVDALGDVLTANGVYQIAQGNFNRAGLSLDAVLRGEAIADQEVIRIPRTGTGCTHRVFQLLDAPGTAGSGWAQTPLQVRALAEPFLNAWAAKLLPAPDGVGCQAAMATGEQRTVRIADLQLCPLDAVFIGAAELSQRVTAFLGAAPASPVDFSHAPAPAGGALISFDQFLAITLALHALVRGSRPLTATDLTSMDDPGVPGIDTAALGARTDAAVAAMRAAHDAAVAGDASALLRAAHFGLSNAVPLPGNPPAQVAAAAADLATRLAAVDALTAQFNPATASADTALAYERGRMQALFGADFQITAPFTLTQPGELATAFAASDALLGNRPTEAANWFMRTAQVRPQLRSLADVLRFADLYLGVVPPFTVGQLPFAAGEPWLALAADPDTTRKGQLSLFSVGAVNLTQSLAGIVFDEWNEVIPDAQQTTAVTLHFERPGARAPHAILLAVAPDLTKPWDLPTLEAILLETLEMAKIRLIDQDTMQELDQYLPALLFSINAAGDTASTDFGVR